MGKDILKDVEASSLPDAVKNASSSGESYSAGLRLDSNGLLLSPQPSEDPLDPLNWKPWLKLVVLLEVSMLSFLALFNAALSTPTFIPLSKYLHQTITKTAYITSIFIAFAGASSLFWNPISNVYGRRPIYIVSIALSIATSAASGTSSSYGGLLAFRALNGFFGGVALGLGSATVRDLYFTHERGFYMGIYTLSLITGGHVAPIIGGFIERSLTWRWSFHVPAIITAFMLPLFILTVPETLYPHTQLEQGYRPFKSWMHNMTMKGSLDPYRRLRFIDFFRPLQMLRYPSVSLPTLCYAVSFGWGSILFIISSADIFAKTYHFRPYQTGVLLGVPLTVGSLLGEMLSGAFSDWMSNRRALARGGARKPEDRLFALGPAIILLPLGLIIEGVCIERKTHWSGVGMGIAIASFGLQIASTTIYTYSNECYRPQAAEIGTLLNFCRQIFGFCVGFYAVELGEEIGFQNAWIVLLLSILPSRCQS